MMFSYSTGVALTAGALLVAAAAGPTQAGSGTTWTPASRLWATTSTGTDIGTAVSGDGTQAVLMSAGKASVWSQGAWGKAQRVYPQEDLYGMDHPDVVMSANGKKSVATWAGDSDEGVDVLYRSSKVGAKKWKSEYYGTGAADIALGTDGGRAVLGWLDIDPEDGLADRVYVSDWTGTTWSPNQALSAPGIPLDEEPPVVAVDADSNRAVAAWSQGGSLRVALYDGAWSAPYLGHAGRIPLAATFDGLTGNVALVTGRFTAVDEVTLEQATVTPAGAIAIAVVPLGTIPVADLLEVDVQLSQGGATGLVAYRDRNLMPSRFRVATWTAAQPFTVHDAGVDMSTVALASGADRALLTSMTWSTSVTTAVRVSTWDGTSWTAAKKVGACEDRAVAAGVSANGTTMVAAWTCGHVHAVRSPKPPAKVKKLSATVSRSKAKLRWRAAKNADSYEYKVKGRKAPHGWQNTTRTRAKVRIVPGNRYRVQVRGVNVGGAGPVSKLRFS